MTHIVFHNRWALGDTVCLTALIRDIAHAHPGRFAMHPSGNFKSAWVRNPHVVRGVDVNKLPNSRFWKVEYKDGIQASKGPFKGHYLTWFYREFEKFADVKVPVLQPHGDLYLEPRHAIPKVEGRYWLLLAGGKDDITAKWWHPARWQHLADTMRQHGLKCVQAGQRFSGNNQWKLRDVNSLVDKTPDIRDFFGAIANAEGVVCGVTSAMHIAAVFHKPCVVLAGGREGPAWEAYHPALNSFGPRCAPLPMPHRYLHTIGLLDCCRSNGCWKTFTVMPPDGVTYKNKPVTANMLCKHPVHGRPAIPKCMDMIEVDHAMEAVMSYYTDGLLPPIGEPSRRYSLPQVVEAEPAPEPPAKVKTRPRVKTAPPPGSVSSKTFLTMDHPIIGGRYTVFVLCYGDFPDLARRCIESIRSTLPPDRREIRVGANAVSARTMEYLTSLPRNEVTRIYPVDRTPAPKYPAMRAMFHDPKMPIETPYVVWFDDDSHAVDPRWAASLTDTIIANHPHGVRLYGPKVVHDLRMYMKNGQQPLDWFRAATWWRNQHLRMPGRNTHAPNGTVIEFASGSFWALCAQTIKDADIPDVRLSHRGGDVTIGAQVHQSGGRIKDFSTGKRPVRWSDHAKRGLNHIFPWAPAGSPLPR